MNGGAFRPREGGQIAVKRDLSVPCVETWDGSVVDDQVWKDARVVGNLRNLRNFLVWQWWTVGGLLEGPRWRVFDGDGGISKLVRYFVVEVGGWIGCSVGRVEGRRRAELDALQPCFSSLHHLVVQMMQLRLESVAHSAATSEHSQSIGKKQVKSKTKSGQRSRSNRWQRGERGRRY